MEANQPQQIRRELNRLLAQSSVNPQPISYWGSAYDSAGNPNRLFQIWEGRSEAYTDDIGETRVRFICSIHESVLATPDKFSTETDEDFITGYQTKR
jgi:hypothetical protein